MRPPQRPRTAPTDGSEWKTFGVRERVACRPVDDAVRFDFADDRRLARIAKNRDRFAQSKRFLFDETNLRSVRVCHRDLRREREMSKSKIEWKGDHVANSTQPLPLANLAAPRKHRKIGCLLNDSPLCGNWQTFGRRRKTGEHPDARVTFPAFPRPLRYLERAARRNAQRLRRLCAPARRGPQTLPAVAPARRRFSRAPASCELPP